MQIWIDDMKKTSTPYSEIERKRKVKQARSQEKAKETFSKLRAKRKSKKRRKC